MPLGGRMQTGSAGSARAAAAGGRSGGTLQLGSEASLAHPSLPVPFPCGVFLTELWGGKQDMVKEPLL